MSKLSQLEIRKTREALDSEITELKAKIAELQVKKDALQKGCHHPKRYQYSAMGELGWKCPDCGWQT